MHYKIHRWLWTVILAECLTADGAVRFTESQYLADIGLEMPRLVEARACRVDMPAAEAYLVTHGRKRFTEDRYDVCDLWRATTIRYDARDGASNRLMVARLDFEPPDTMPDQHLTRGDFYTTCDREQRLSFKDEGRRDDAVAWAVAPLETGKAERARRDGRQNFLAFVEYPVTNDAVRVVAFRPRPTNPKCRPPWFVAVFQTPEGDNAEESLERFDEEFLDKITCPKEADFAFPKIKEERDWLARDLRRSVTNYPDWHLSESADVMVVDDMAGYERAAFISALTNALPRLREAYRKAIPTPLTDETPIAVVRVFDDRRDYLNYAGEEAAWTAAFWCPVRRELVMALGDNTAETLLATARHEAFHQYLDYAGGMTQAAPWLNEGHAELFEHAAFDSRGNLTFLRDEEAVQMILSDPEACATMLPLILEMDYEQFYAGSAEEVRAKYRLAWSIAYFLEVGAPEVRFRPFENLRADYMKALVRSFKAREATHAVFTDDVRKNFISEWLAFWRKP